VTRPLLPETSSAQQFRTGLNPDPHRAVLMTTARVGGMGKARWADLFRLSSVACRRSRSFAYPPRRGRGSRAGLAA